MKTFVKSILILLFFIVLVTIFFFFRFRIVVPPASEDSKKQLEGVLRNEAREEAQKQEFSGTIDEVIGLVNEARKEKGLETLKKNDRLTLSAQKKAEDMRDKEYFAHVSPSGRQPWLFVEQAGYRYKTMGENLAEGYFSAGSVHEAWMNSEGHRKNILSADFEEIGVAVVEYWQNGARTYIAVQHFASQLRPGETVQLNICRQSDKKECEKAEEKEEDLEDAIKDQKKIIKEAEEDGADEEDLEEMEKNLETLKEAEDELEKYLLRCESFVDKCDQWVK